MKAGRMRDRLVIERASVVTDDYGGEVKTWGTLCEPYAEVIYGRGDERRQAAQEGASLTATFRVRANPVTAGVLPTDRIQFQGAVWDISSAVPGKERDSRDITATRAV